MFDVKVLMSLILVRGLMRIHVQLFRPGKGASEQGASLDDADQFLYSYDAFFAR